MTIKAYRGTSDICVNENRYYTEDLAVAKTYIGWRKGSWGGELIEKEFCPLQVFDANNTQSFEIATVIANEIGLDASYIKQFADHYSNKPKNAFVGLVIAFEIENRESGMSHADAETAVIAILKSKGYDFIKQSEKGGAPYPDGTIQKPSKKHITWISTN